MNLLVASRRFILQEVFMKICLKVSREVKRNMTGSSSHWLTTATKTTVPTAFSPIYFNQIKRTKKILNYLFYLFTLITYGKVAGSKSSTQPISLLKRFKILPVVFFKFKLYPSQFLICRPIYL